MRSSQGILLFQLLLLLRSPLPCWTANQSIVKIVGGSTTTVDQYPYARVSLQKPRFNGDTNAHQCGGVLVAPDIVLTASHCADYVTQAHIGRHNFRSQSEIYNTINIQLAIKHPSFNIDGFRYDVAIIVLEETVQDIVPVRINSDATEPASGTNLLVLGWGATEYSSTIGASTYSNLFLYGQVQSMSNAECSVTFINNEALYLGEIFPEMICASVPGIDACSGDSGGPLILPGRNFDPDLLVGLVSWGRGCAIYPGVYSRVGYSYEWIRSEICYSSINPPTYLDCLATERGPDVIDIDSATTNANTEDEVEETLQPTMSPTNPPTQTPTSKPTTTRRTVAPINAEGFGYMRPTASISVVPIRVPISANQSMADPALTSDLKKNTMMPASQQFSDVSTSSSNKVGVSLFIHIVLSVSTLYLMIR